MVLSFLQTLFGYSAKGRPAPDGLLCCPFIFKVNSLCILIKVLFQGKQETVHDRSDLRIIRLK